MRACIVIGLVVAAGCAAGDDLAGAEEALYVPPAHKGTVLVGGLDGKLRRFDPATNQLTGTVNLGGQEIWLARSPDGSQVFASNVSAGNVFAVNPATLALVRRGLGSLEPSAMVVSPDGGSLTVATVGGGILARLSTANLAAEAVIEYAVGGGRIDGLAWVPAAGVTFGARLFAAPGYGKEISRKTVGLFGSSWSSVTVSAGDLDEGDGFFGLAWHPHARAVLAVNSQADRLHVLDDRTGAELGSIKTDGLPMSVAVMPGTATAYVPHLRGIGFPGKETVGVYAVNRSELEPILVERIATIHDVCEDAYHVAFSEDEPRAFLACRDQLVEIDTTTHKVVKRYPELGGFDVVWVP